MDVDGEPPNVRVRSVLGTMADPPAEMAIRASVTASGDVPNAFESRTRTLSPPMLTWAICRRVWPSMERGAPGTCGLAPQVLVQRVRSFDEGLLAEADPGTVRHTAAAMAMKRLPGSFSRERTIASAA